MGSDDTAGRADEAGGAVVATTTGATLADSSADTMLADAANPLAGTDGSYRLSPSTGGPTPPTLRSGGELPISPEIPMRYDREGDLGEGGFGRVEAVFDRQLDRSVALKQLLPPEGVKDETTLTAIMRGREARFLNEARITGKLEHPGIVPVYELGRRLDGSLYYVMRLVQGRDLERALRDKSFDERMKLLPHFVDACQAVAYAHSRGVVHRDLKPENVMIGDYGETLVVDWGLAKVRGEEDLQETAFAEGMDRLRHQSNLRTIEGIALGTPCYMPPEQCLGELGEIDERSDVYALGAVLYHLLTGAPPHIGDDVETIIKATIRQDPTPPRDEEPRCPSELDAIVLRALDKDKLERYANAGELADDVQAFLEGGLVGAHRYSVTERVGRWVRAHRLRLLAVAALVVGASGAWLYVDGRARARASQAAEARAEAEARADRARRQELLAELETILEQTSKGSTAPRWLETQAFKIISLGEPVAAAAIEARLIRELEHPSRDVRRLVARSLAGLHRTHAVQALSARLAEDAEQDDDVLIEIVNALGVIGDPAAEEPVAELRWRKGQFSPFWEQTKLAYRLIPLPELADGGAGLTAEQWNDRGKALVHKNHRDEAIVAYSKAIEKDRKDARGYNNRAIELARLERYDEALADYDQAIALDADAGLVSRYNRAVLKRKIDDFEGAIADYSALVAVEFRLPTILRGRSVAHRYMGDYEAALADLETAHDVEPRDPRTYSAMATVYTDMGRWREAVDAATQAVSINPQYVAALVTKAHAHRQLGELDAARRDLDAALDLDPQSDTARLSRATLLLHDGRVDDAVDDLSHCIDNDCTTDAESTASRLYYRGAGLHAQRQDWDAAIRDLERAFALGPPRTQQVQLALAGLIASLRQAGGENAESWRLRLAPRSADLFVERLLRVVLGQEPYDELLADTKAKSRLCQVYIAGGLERELAGDVEGARARYALCEAVERPADPDCLMASAASGHHPHLE